MESVRAHLAHSRHPASRGATTAFIDMHQQINRKFLYIIAAAFMLIACENPRKDTVWELYDIRHPVPVDSRVPPSRAGTYDKASDYDTYYTPPKHETCALHNYSTFLCK